jgi:prepilin-type processing-associated H-X9-DG protein
MKTSRGFTLIELLAIIFVIALMAALGLPAIAKTRHQTVVAQCAANLTQVTTALHIYGSENKDRLPSAPTNGLPWAWDMPWDLGPTLGRYGASRNALYCPANPGQNVDNLWNYAPNSYRVIGYSMTLSGAPSVNVSNWNATLTPQWIPYGPISIPPPLASQRVLVGDATLSQSGQDNEASRSSYNYSSIQGSYVTPMRTSHLDRSLPIGGNLGMLDGHVEWRSFQAMHVRTPQGSFTPVFWW